jgi:hypothetical protein
VGLEARYSINDDRHYWGIDPNIGAPTVKNQWNSVMVNPDFIATLPSLLFEQQFQGGGAQQGADPRRVDPYLRGGSADQAPPSPVKQTQAPKRGAPPASTPPVVIDMTDEFVWRLYGARVYWKIQYK